MVIDLRNDAETIRVLLKSRVSAFLSIHGTVSRIEVGYSFEQNGFVSVHFDTRENAKPDGSWAQNIEGNSVECPHWPAAFEAIEGGEVAFVLADGKQLSLAADTDSEQLAAIIGMVVKKTLLDARDNGVFASLPKAQRCELAAEELEGRYGWPDYEDRGTENLV